MNLLDFSCVRVNYRKLRARGSCWSWRCDPHCRCFAGLMSLGNYHVSIFTVFSQADQIPQKDWTSARRIHAWLLTSGSQVERRLGSLDIPYPWFHFPMRYFQCQLCVPCFPSLRDSLFCPLQRRNFLSLAGIGKEQLLSYLEWGRRSGVFK